MESPKVASVKPVFSDGPAKSSTWKSKAALIAGLGVPLGVVLAGNPAAAQDFSGSDGIDNDTVNAPMLEKMVPVGDYAPIGRSSDAFDPDAWAPSPGFSVAQEARPTNVKQHPGGMLLEGDEGVMIAATDAPDIINVWPSDDPLLGGVVTVNVNRALAGTKGDYSYRALRNEPLTILTGDSKGGNDRVGIFKGTKFAERITIIGGPGDLEVVDAGAAGVRYFPGGGTNDISAGDGDDFFFAGPGSVNTFDGNKGDDFFFAGPGSVSTFDGGPQADTFLVSDSSSGNSLEGGRGYDRYFVDSSKNTIKRGIGGWMEEPQSLDEFPWQEFDFGFSY